jgi:hypothetical protein
VGACGRENSIEDKDLLDLLGVVGALDALGVLGSGLS